MSPHPENPAPAATGTAYDAVPYPNYAHPQTHPDRMATAARLYGLKPRPIDRCRVLELGCGAGSNLIPMAYHLPESEFVGLDLAASRIAEGNRHIASFGLGNIRLLAKDLGDVTEELGVFDFIIAHGVYSWVPAPVRDRLLAVCRQNLAAEGVAFVSYNALPGAHATRMLREMLQFHVRDLTSPAERVGQSLALLGFLSGTTVRKDPLMQWIKDQAEAAVACRPGHLFHDHLAETNDALYFKDFVAHAAGHRLQYLAEADFFELADFHFTPAVRAALRQVEANRLLREQYLDFLKCRRFRQTLLCREECRLTASPSAEGVAGLYVEAIEPYKLGGFDLRHGVEAVITTTSGGHMRTDFGPGKSAIAILGECWPDRLPFDELLRRAQARSQAAGDSLPDEGQLASSLQRYLLELFRGGIISLHTWRPRFTTALSELPLVSPLARWQAADQEMVSSVFHTGVQLGDEISRHLISLLDGTRDQAALREDMCAFLRSRRGPEDEVIEESEFRGLVGADVERILEKLARFGLLVG